MIIEMMLSGFLFLFIIITNLASERFGHETFSDLDSDAKLQMINKNPKKFKISIVIILIEHGNIIALAILLFIEFGVVGCMRVLGTSGKGNPVISCLSSLTPIFKF